MAGTLDKTLNIGFLFNRMYKILILLLISGYCQAQTGWELLATTSVRKGTDPFFNEEIELPEFSEELLKKEGQSITLEGFIIPLQQATDQDFFILSRFPYQSCFFCGAAGPETVVEVFSDRSFRYTDERVRVRGTLYLNPDDPLRLFFIMKDCEVVSI